MVRTQMNKDHGVCGNLKRSSFELAHGLRGYRAMRCVFGLERRKNILCYADTLRGCRVGQVLRRSRPSCWYAAPLFSLVCHLLLISNSLIHSAQCQQFKRALLVFLSTSIRGTFLWVSRSHFSARVPSKELTHRTIL